MVTFLNAPEKKPSFSSMLGAKLGQGIEKGVSQGINFAQQMQLEKSKGRGLAQEAKNLEKSKLIETGLGTIARMKELVQGGRLGRGSGFLGFFDEDQRRDRAEYEQLGRSLLPLVSQGMRLTNRQEFEEYKKVLTDPGASDAEIEGALKGLEDRLIRSASQEEGSFSSKVMGEDKKKSVEQSPLTEEDSHIDSGESRKKSSWLNSLAKGLIKGGRSFSPLPNLGGVPDEIAEDLMERFLPTEKGGVSDILQFSAENVPLAALGEGGLVKKAAQSVIGGLSKTAAKSAGSPEWLQEVASGLGMASPDLAKSLASKALLPSAKQSELVNYLTQKGLSERQITALMQDKKKLSTLGKYASKFEEKHRFTKGLQDSLGNIYDDIKSKGAQKSLYGKGLENFRDDLDRVVDSVNPLYREEAEKYIKHFSERPATFKTLQELYESINAKVGGIEGGRAVVNKLKEPIEKAMIHVDPVLYKEKKFLDPIYGKMKDFTQKMTAKQSEAYINLAKTAPAATSLLFLDFGALSALPLFGPRIAKEFLTNPRLQRIHAKMWQSFKNGNMQQVLKLNDLFIKDLKKDRD